MLGLKRAALGTLAALQRFVSTLWEDRETKSQQIIDRSAKLVN